jgi:hypothetical protein
VGVWRRSDPSILAPVNRLSIECSRNAYFSAGAVIAFSITFYQSQPEPRPMADFTKEWIEHLKAQISGRMNIVADKMDPQSYDELVTDLAWFTFRFARDPDTKMRKVFR